MCMEFGLERKGSQLPPGWHFAFLAVQPPPHFGHPLIHNLSGTPNWLGRLGRHLGYIIAHTSDLWQGAIIITAPPLELNSSHSCLSKMGAPPLSRPPLNGYPAPAPLVVWCPTNLTPTHRLDLVPAHVSKRTCPPNQNREKKASKVLGVKVL